MLSWRRRFTKRAPQADETAPPREAAPAPLPEEVYREAARHFLDVQISTLDVLDNKTAQSFSVGSVALPVTFALLNLGDGEVPTVALWALVLALVFYVGLLISAAQASRIRGLEYRPNIQALRKHSEKYPGEALDRWVANEYEESTRVNADVLVRKARWVGAAALALYLEALFLSAAAIATLLL